MNTLRWFWLNRYSDEVRTPVIYWSLLVLALVALWAGQIAGAVVLGYCAGFVRGFAYGK